MAAHGGMVARQQQTATMVPEHIMGKAVLKMNLQELQQFVEMQFAENPALVMEEESRCPACGCTLSGDFCPTCGSEKFEFSELPSHDNDEWQEPLWSSSVSGDDDYYEPFASVAVPKSLYDHLKEQARITLEDEELTIAEFLIDCLDEDGFLREPLIDIANHFRKSVPQLEAVLTLIQQLDPPGVAARDMQECLLLQLKQSADDSPERSLAERIISDQWDYFSKVKFDKIASALKVKRDLVYEAVEYIRENTTPHPASMFRDPWDRLAPRGVSRSRPDVIVHQIDSELIAEIPDAMSGRIAVEDMYASLYAEISQKKSDVPESDRSHIKEAVTKARGLIDALEFRKSTLRKIIDELIKAQAEFFINGPSALKPMNKKDLAAIIGVHESTVSRATQDKTLRLPSGEVIEFDVLFDSALPVKEMVRILAVQRLSDGEIAEKLAESGIQIARRTVAKYRDQLRVLPVELRTAR